MGWKWSCMLCCACAVSSLRSFCIFIRDQNGCQGVLRDVTDMSDAGNRIHPSPTPRMLVTSSPPRHSGWSQVRTRKYRIESNCAGAGGGGPDRSSPILLDIVVACGRTAKKYTNHDVDSSSRGRRSRPVPPPPKCCGCSMRRGFCCWHRSIIFHSGYCITHPSARDATNATHAVELHY